MCEKDIHANKCKHEKRFLEGCSLFLFIISQIFALFGTQQQDFSLFSAREIKQGCEGEERRKQERIFTTTSFANFTGTSVVSLGIYIHVEMS